MKGFLTLLATLLLAASAVSAYRVNYQTQAVISDVARLQHQIAREREALGVLRADWAYLNRPERLLALSEKYFGQLQLMPLNAAHYADPEKLAFADTEAMEMSALIAAAIAQVQAEEAKR